MLNRNSNSESRQATPFVKSLYNPRRHMRRTIHFDGIAINTERGIAE